MKVPAVFYSAKLDCCVIVRGKAIDETGKECIPVEWDWQDLGDFQEKFGFECEPFMVGKFVHICDL